MHKPLRDVAKVPVHAAEANGRSVSVRIEHLVMFYGSVPAVRGIDFSVSPGETLTLLGPSGCGKTTTLRCIAGLEVPTDGHITIGNDVVYDRGRGIFVAPERRNIGMVFQSYAIWPHMSVGGNVGFPLSIAGVGKAEVRERTRTVLDLVGLGDLAARSAADLSGGQQQRVALARALVHEPRVVLFDEPLSNLDANLRARMRAELQVLQARLGFTAIFVTHDQEEALSLSDNIVIMNRGRIEQAGRPQEIFKNPQTAFTARFLGYSNIFPGHVVTVDVGGSVTVALDNGLRLSARWRSDSLPKPECDCVVAFRADRVGLQAGSVHPDENRFAGTVETAAFLGTRFDYMVQASAAQVQAEGPVDQPFARGEAVTLTIAPDHCHAFRNAAED
jgi:iron(III) transport system ATP-binding protein